MDQFIKFIKDWQELAGAFLGSSLAIILSGVGYLIVRQIESARERRETMRRIEVDITYILNTVHAEQEKLRFFVERSRKLILEIKAIANPKEFAMHTINFPNITGIYLDDEIPHFIVGSYYLHNKLLWIHYGVQDTNGTLTTLKTGYDRILKLNETMISLMVSTNLNPPAQRKSYADNLELFTNEIERFYKYELPKGIKTLVQVKVYNEKLRKGFWRGLYYKWKHEGTKFKYFRNSAELKKFARNLYSIDRIDAEIEKEVQGIIQEMEQRSEKLKSGI